LEDNSFLEASNGLPEGNSVRLRSVACPGAAAELRG
jgi:hypothetical protein